MKQKVRQKESKTGIILWLEGQSINVKQECGLLIKAVQPHAKDLSIH